MKETLYNLVHESLFKCSFIIQTSWPNTGHKQSLNTPKCQCKVDTFTSLGNKTYLQDSFLKSRETIQCCIQCWNNTMLKFAYLKQYNVEICRTFSLIGNTETFLNSRFWNRVSIAPRRKSICCISNNKIKLILIHNS